MWFWRTQLRRLRFGMVRIIKDSLQMEIRLGNWLYNAGILGFLRILDKFGEDLVSY